MSHPARAPLVLIALLSLVPVSRAAAAPTAAGSLVASATARVADQLAAAAPQIKAAGQYARARKLAQAGRFAAADRLLWSLDRFDVTAAGQACADPAFDEMVMAPLPNSFLEEHCSWDEGC
jgi:hypothetical protein